MNMPLVGLGPDMSSPSKRNKRKSLEPKRLTGSGPKRVKLDMMSSSSDGEDHTNTPSPRLASSLSPGSECRSPSPPPFSMMAPPKKRFKKEALKVDEAKKNKSPFRPWDIKDDESSTAKKSMLSYPGYWSLLLNSYQQQQQQIQLLPQPGLDESEQQEPLDLVKRSDDDTAKSDTVPEKPVAPSTKQMQRNYKNMTKERRMEANARERQRVQAITESYEKLRDFIPLEDKGVKLSKLSIIKISTSYILLLARQLGYDYSKDGSNPSEAKCKLDLETLIKEARAMTSVNEKD